MPYDPGVVDQSGQIFAQGTTRGLDNLFAGYQKMREQKKREVDNGKIAESIVRSNPEFLQALGMHPDEFAGLSAKDKSNSVQGVLEGVGYQKAVQDVKRLKALGEGQEIETKGAGERLQGLERFNTGMQGYENTPPMIRRPDVGNVVKENMFRSGMFPEDMQRTSQSMENLGSMDFQPGKAVPIEGTDYMYAPLSGRGGTPLPKAGMTRNGSAQKKSKFEGAPNESWVTTDDEKLFAKKFNEVTDPHAKEAILAVRRSYKLANGKGGNEMVDLINAINGGGKEKKASEGKGLFDKFKSWAK
jgi:hypothetical protein